MTDANSRSLFHEADIEPVLSDSRGGQKQQQTCEDEFFFRFLRYVRESFRLI
jgi:hypothetical protein